MTNLFRLFLCLYSSEDDIDQLLSTAKQIRRARTQSSEDDFEKEMNNELDCKINSSDATSYMKKMKTKEEQGKHDVT